MLQEDKPFELIYDPAAGAQTSDAGGVSSALFCSFVKHALMKRFPSFSEANPASPAPFPAPGVAKAVTPANSMYNVIVLDILSLIAKKNHKKIAILHPDSLTRCLGQEANQRSNERRQMLTDLQDALLAADLVLAFNQADLMPLMVLGAPRLRAVPFPALAAKPPAHPRFDLLIIDHGDDDAVPAALLAEIEADGTGLTARVWHERPDNQAHTAASMFGTAARIHLHVATAGPQSTRFRMVDSLAQRTPIIQMANDIYDLPKLDHPTPPARIEHNHTGLCISGIQGLLPAVKSLLHDSAMADLFSRNGHRIAAHYNAAVESLMLGALT